MNATKAASVAGGNLEYISGKIAAKKPIKTVVKAPQLITACTFLVGLTS